MAKIEHEIVEEEKESNLEEVSQETDQDMNYELPKRKKKTRVDIDESKLEKIQLPDIYGVANQKKSAVKEVASIDFD